MIRYWPFGPHTSIGNKLDGIGLIWEDLNSKGIPTTIKSVDGYGPCYELMNIGDKHGVENVCVFRLGSKDGHNWGVPNWHAPSPEEAAVQHVMWTLKYLPPEFDKRVWLELINEPDKDEDVSLGWTPAEYADWLGRFSQEAGRLLVANGYRYLAYGYSSGEPEIEDWSTPGQLDYLALCGQYPDQLGVAVHEYSYNPDDAPYDGWLIGRFERMFKICDQHNIPRPKTYISEFGWTLWEIPDPVAAIPQMIELADQLYARHPQILGAGIWHFGTWSNSIKLQAHKLLEPMHQVALDYRLEVEEPPMTECYGKPREDYRRVFNVLPQASGDATFQAVFKLVKDKKETIGYSWDDACIGDLTNKTAVFWDFSPEERQLIDEFVRTYYPGTKVEFRVSYVAPPPPPSTGIDLAPYFWPAQPMGTVYELRRPDGSQERVQHQTNGNELYITKGTGGQDGKSEYEFLFLDDQHIWRGIDTSPGSGRFYVQYEPGMTRAKWCKRRMSIGETFYGPGHKVQFFMKSDCSKSSANSGNAQNIIKFVDQWDVFPVNGLEIKDVIMLQQPGGETWYFARGIGMIGWESAWGSSWISEIHQPGARPDNEREVICSNWQL